MNITKVSFLNSNLRTKHFGLYDSNSKKSSKSQIVSCKMNNGLARDLFVGFIDRVSFLGGRHILPANEDKLKEYCKRGYTLKQIAIDLGFSPDTVSKALKKLGLKASRNNITDGREDEIVSMYLEGGMTHAEIAEEISCSPETIAKTLEKLGITKEYAMAYRRNKIIDLYTNENMDVYAIAKRLNCSIRIVKNIIKDYNKNK